jgi:hypothetical protein
MHGTPIGLVAELNDDDDTGTDVRIDTHEPNSLVYIYLWFPLGIAEKVVGIDGGSGFKDRFTKIGKALQRFKERLGA